MNELNLADLNSRAEAELRFEARVTNFSLRNFSRRTSSATTPAIGAG